MSEQDILYIRGFNNGYLMAKYIPEVLAKIVQNIQSSNAYIVGIICGKEECERENLSAGMDELDAVRKGARGHDTDLER